MRLCTVIGTVVATSHHSALDGRKILVVRDDDGSPALQLAIDGVGAGRGCRVLVADSGAAASEVTGLSAPPVRSVIVGLVDAEGVAA